MKHKNLEYFFTDSVFQKLNITHISLISEKSFNKKYIIKSSDREEFSGTDKETERYLNKINGYFLWKSRMDKLKTIIDE